VPPSTDSDLSRSDAVLELHDALAAGVHLADVQQLAVDGVARALDAAAALWFDEPHGLVLACVSHPDRVAKQRMLDLTHDMLHEPTSFVAQALAGGEAVALTGEQVTSLLPVMEPAYRAWFGERGVSGMLLHPLQCRDRDVGVLGVSRDAGAAPFTDQDSEHVGRLSRILAVALDSARALDHSRAAGALSSRLARRDSLTSLPNRRALMEVPQPRSGCTGLLLIDLDGFKQVNDGFGHPAGDAVLVDFAHHMSEAVPHDATLVRLGGDEFACLLHDTHAERVRARAHAVAEAAHCHVQVGGLDIPVQASTGLALTEDGSEDVWTLLQRADLAMYRAKHNGLGHTEFSPELDAAAANRLRDTTDLRGAIARRELVVHFQRVEPADPRGEDEPARLEALVRWPHDGQLHAPGSFLPLAASGGLMADLTRLVLDLAVQQLVVLQGAGQRSRVAVNIPASVLVLPQLPAAIADLVAEAGLPPGSVSLEISESELAGEAARAASIRYADLGIDVEIDDFGTGFASYGTLLQVPASGLKLDRSLVTGIDTDSGRRKLLKHVIALAHDFGVGVVAEGVESEQDREAVVELGCDYLQGFLLHRPCPGAELLG
jgi:diguanylate cyclase (GGDEF)-like protein